MYEIVRESYYYDADFCNVNEFYDYLRNIQKVDESVIREYMSKYPTTGLWNRFKVYDIGYKDERRKAFMNWYADQKLKEFKKSIKGKHYFMQISYSDNDGELDSELEHDIMPSLDCTVKTINNH